jgi:hypothetical protein
MSEATSDDAPFTLLVEVDGASTSAASAMLKGKPCYNATSSGSV